MARPTAALADQSTVQPLTPWPQYNRLVTERPPRPPRAEPREVVELKQLKADQPELASAVDMQLALVDMQRRVQSRVPLPWISAGRRLAARRSRRPAAPLVRFGDIPLDWTDFRLTLRQTADILRRFDALEPRRAHSHHRARARRQRARAARHARGTTRRRASRRRSRERLPTAPPSLDQVLVLALRPFLARCAEALTQRADCRRWQHGHCPFCGWEPEFAVITPSADRRLICGRCSAQWAFAAAHLPVLRERRPRAHHVVRHARRPLPRVRCDVCRRYLKAYDARNAARPVMVAVDTIATLPLDAAAMQRGYVGRRSTRSR